MSAGTLIAIFVIGGGLFLLMEKPVIFWLVALPIALLIIFKFIKWLKGK